MESISIQPRTKLIAPPCPSNALFSSNVDEIILNEANTKLIEINSINQLMKIDNINNIEVNELNTNVQLYNQDNIEKYYQLYLNAFPSDINKELGWNTKGISLRTGNKSTVKTKLIKLLTEYTIDEIIGAIRLNIQDKISTSTSIKNDLQFMSRMGTWINQSITIDELVNRYRNINNKLSLLKNNTINTVRSNSKLV